MRNVFLWICEAGLLTQVIHSEKCTFVDLLGGSLNTGDSQ